MSLEALKQYKSVSLESDIDEASPHKLIGLLLSGLIERLAMAKAAIGRGEIARKGELLSASLNIISNLRSQLNVTEGGEIAENLSALYGYMETRLLSVTVEGNTEAIDEVSRLVKEIKQGWDAIPQEMRL